VDNNIDEIDKSVSLFVLFEFWQVI